MAGRGSHGPRVDWIYKLNRVCEGCGKTGNDGAGYPRKKKIAQVARETADWTKDGKRRLTPHLGAPKDMRAILHNNDTCLRGFCRRHNIEMKEARP